MAIDVEACTTRPVDPDFKYHTGQPLHLYGTRVGHVIKADEDQAAFYAATGRRIARANRYEGSSGYTPSLNTCAGPAVVGTFRQETFHRFGTGPYNADVTALVEGNIILGDRNPYQYWRVRGLYNSRSGTYAMGGYSSAFVRNSNGWGLDFGSYVSGYVQYHAGTGYRYYWSPSHDVYFVINFQVEVGYSMSASDPWADGGSNENWPAYGLDIAQSNW